MGDFPKKVGKGSQADEKQDLVVPYQVLCDKGEAADVERPPRLQGLQLDPHARTQLRALPTSPGRPEVGLKQQIKSNHYHLEFIKS